MKKKQLFLSLLMITTLFSCGNKDNPSDDLKDLPWAEGRTQVDESKLTGEILTTTKVRVHYTRPSLDYANWNIWAWASEPVSGEGSSYQFSLYDQYGVVSDIDLSSFNVDTISKMGIILRKSTSDNEWAEKDVEVDRFITIPEKTSDGIYDIYMSQGREMIYESIDEASKETILSSYASFIKRGEERMTAIVNLSIDGKEIEAGKVSIYEDGTEIAGYTTNVFESSSMIQILLPQDFEYDFEKKYTVKYEFSSSNICESTLVLYDIYNTTSFGEKYNYSGDDLGVTFSNNKLTTNFKLWAPISKSVTLNIYNSGTKSETNKPIKTIPLTKEEKGVWSVSVNEYLHGKYYTYTVENDEGTSEVVDPYAKSCGLNGLIGMIVDFDVINEQLNWDQVERPELSTFQNNVDASIYEMHIRDMTIDSTSGVSEKNRGNYLGLTEEGTSYTKDGKTVTTGLAHLKELGVSHVQILPFYDFNSVDEAKDGYNWGYDPLNYNCLEGSYSSNPEDGLNRIIEFKTMMKSLLENDIQVNMDVVYNHTAGTQDSNFEKIIPGYYHRLDSKFAFSNGSGCGNEMASDHYMYRKFIVDSTKFWLSEYKLSGYRFDLMGLIDTTTMEEVYKECSKIYDKVMIYGEPWTGGTSSLSPSLQTNQTTLTNIDGIVGAFNDKIRNAIKGDNTPGLGWVQGKDSNVNPIKKGLMGNFSGDIDPNRVINYVSCHDNYTLFDQLDKTLSGTRKENLHDVYKQSEALVFTSQGITFMQEGEDFLRTKSAGTGSQIHNSYNAGDKVNKMDYELKVENIEMFNYFKDLISLRKENSLFRLASREKISQQMSFVSDDNKVIAFKLNDSETNEELYVIHTLDALENYNLNGQYQLIFDHTGKVSSSTSLSTISLDANSSVVLKKI